MSETPHPLAALLVLAQRVRRAMKRDNNRFYAQRYFANIDLLIAGLHAAIDPTKASPQKAVSTFSVDEAQARIEEMLREVARQQEEALQLLTVAKDLAETHDLAIVNGHVQRIGKKPKKRRRRAQPRGILFIRGPGRKAARKRRKRPTKATPPITGATIPPSAWTSLDAKEF